MLLKRVVITLGFLTCLSSSFLWASVVHAQQTAFSAKSVSGSTQFDFQWRDKEQSYRLNFAIPNPALYAMPDSPAVYSQRLLRESVYRQVMLKAQKIDPTLASINIIKQGDGLSFNVRSRNQEKAQEILRELEAAHTQAQEDYWKDNLFVQFAANTGQTAIRHDHAQYTALSAKSLAPIVEAIKGIQQQPNNPREFVSIALSWIQSIPYNTLESRISSNGAGFVSPRDLIMQNQGDCDSKSTLMAAVLKAYNPRIDVQMVYLPEHALLGLAMRKRPKDRTITQKGISYVLLEPTGPAQFSIGEVADSTKMALRNRQFDLLAL